MVRNSGEEHEVVVYSHLLNPFRAYYAWLSCYIFRAFHLAFLLLPPLEHVLHRLAKLRLLRVIFHIS